LWIARPSRQTTSISFRPTQRTRSLDEAAQNKSLSA
jgi:hypothetical protein